MLIINVGEGVELRMRPIEAAETIFRQVDADRARLGRYLDWVEKTETVADIAAYLTRSKEGFAEGKSISLGIWYEDDWIGSIGIHEIDPVHGTGEIGYWICPGYEGRGIMVRSVASLVAYAFRDRGLSLIELKCDPTNDRSEKVAERTGFRFCRMTTVQTAVYAEPKELKLFVLAREEWEQQHTS